MAEKIPHRINLLESMNLIIEINKITSFSKDAIVEEFNDAIMFISDKGEYECYRFLSYIKNNNIKLLDEKMVREYLEKTYSPISKKDNEFVDFSIQKLNIKNNKEIKHFLNELDRVGVYIFSDKEILNKESAIYIGFSTNLKSRIVSSITERKMYNNYNEFYITVIDCFNDIDSSLLELYLINKYNPKLNNSGKYNSESNIIEEINVPIIKQIKCIL